MGGKSIETRIKEAEEKAKAARAKVKALENIARKQDRKDRTRKLIQVGAILSAVGIDTPEKAKRFKVSVEGGSEKFKGWFTRTLDGEKAGAPHPES